MLTSSRTPLLSGLALTAFALSACSSGTVEAERAADTALDAPEVGHVVAHEGRAALFANGSGAIQVMDSTAQADGVVEDGEVEERAAEAAHHGVAVPLSNGNLLLTQGIGETRDTVQVLTPAGEVVAETTDCPGVHGEATGAPTAQGDVVSLGCEHGPVIHRDGALHKGEALHEVDVVEPWEEPEQWQQPGPAVKVAGGRARGPRSEPQPSLRAGPTLVAYIAEGRRA